MCIIIIIIIIIIIGALQMHDGDHDVWILVNQLELRIVSE